MRLVIFSEVDMEPMTVVTVPMSIMKDRRPGDLIRLLGRVPPVSWKWGQEPLFTNSIKAIDIRLEKICLCANRYGVSSTWIGIAKDDGLELRSALLPGQMADYSWEIA